MLQGKRGPDRIHRAMAPGFLVGPGGFCAAGLDYKLLSCPQQGGLSSVSSAKLFAGKHLPPGSTILFVLFLTFLSFPSQTGILPKEPHHTEKFHRDVHKIRCKGQPQVGIFVSLAG